MLSKVDDSFFATVYLSVIKCKYPLLITINYILCIFSLQIFFSSTMTTFSRDPTTITQRLLP